MKYRIWDKVRKYYLDLEDFFVNGNGRICLVSGEEEIDYDYEENPYISSVNGVMEIIDNQDNYIIQLSTGLLDKNGKEIYEGDKIKVYTPNTEYGLQTFYNDIVKFDNGYFQVNGCGLLITTLQSFECEVIGNIFEEVQND